MDGNGRWASKKRLPRISGHQKGVKTVRKITKICGEIGLKILTLYTFSSENWNRPISEVSALMKLLVISLRKEVKDLMQNNVKFTVIGEMNKLEQSVQNELISAINKTKNNTGLNLNLAISYGSREEILHAVKMISNKIINKELTSSQIDGSLFSKMLYTKNLPDPDLLIRTGGDYRLSNFLLWQIAYTELHVTNKFWPEFEKADLVNAIYDYQNRERRYGKISEQLKNSSN